MRTYRVTAVTRAGGQLRRDFTALGPATRMYNANIGYALYVSLWAWVGDKYVIIRTTMN